MLHVLWGAGLLLVINEQCQERGGDREKRMKEPAEGHQIIRQVSGETVYERRTSVQRVYGIGLFDVYAHELTFNPSLNNWITVSTDVMSQGDHMTNSRMTLDEGRGSTVSLTEVLSFSRGFWTETLTPKPRSSLVPADSCVLLGAGTSAPAVGPAAAVSTETSSEVSLEAVGGVGSAAGSGRKTRRSSADTFMWLMFEMKSRRQRNKKTEINIWNTLVRLCGGLFAECSRRLRCDDSDDRLVRDGSRWFHRTQRERGALGWACWRRAGLGGKTVSRRRFLLRMWHRSCLRAWEEGDFNRSQGSRRLFFNIYLSLSLTPSVY